MNKAATQATQSLEAWRGDPAGLSLCREDLDLVDNVLCVVPELRAVAFLGREARRRGISYPVTGVKQLQALLGKDRFELAGHRIDAKSIARTLPEEWFPLEHEGALLSAIHLGLRRCQAEHQSAVLEQLKIRRREIGTRRTGARKAKKK